MHYLKIKDFSYTPPNGWIFTQKETGFFFQGNTYEDLRKQVVQHRNKYNISNKFIDKQIQTQICENIDPSLCEYTNAIKIGYRKNFNISDVKSFLAAVTNTLKEGGVVSQEEANRRAKICARCPLNKSIGGCYGCGGIANSVFSLIGKRKHGLEGRLKQCKACGCYLDAKVWVPLNAQPKNEQHEYPSHCWMNQD